MTASEPPRPDADPPLPNDPHPEDLLPEDLPAAERVLMLAFDERRRAHLPDKLIEHRRGVRRMRDLAFANDLAPASTFAVLDGTGPDPDLPDEPIGRGVGHGRAPIRPEQAAHATITEIGAALRSGAFTARELTEAYLARIERFDGQLHAVVSVTRERALREADRADRELADGRDRGPLHGMPWLAKDLLATPDAPTSWGATPYRDQRFASDATVVRRLTEAGAVLLGKASLGALAMGDVWFGATTRNPWDPDEGSSGSSAGSAAGVAAGLCAFAIGSETMGSILSPSHRCGVTGLRPTFGRVPRTGAMALSWSLDKLGPIVRAPEDAALVLDALRGRDPADPTSRDASFPWRPEPQVEGLKVGVPRDVDLDAEPATAACLDHLRALGAEVREIDLPDLPTEPIVTLLMVEASAAFDRLIRGPDADALVRQDADAWPTLLRAARFVSGADYVQAQRLQRAMRDAVRSLLHHEVAAIVSLALHGPAMRLGNAAGLPAATVGVGHGEQGRPLGNVAVLADAFCEHRALAVADAAFRRDRPSGPSVPPAFA
ncbi:MAG: amidase [Trueperaceae bacterium]